MTTEREENKLKGKLGDAIRLAIPTGVLLAHQDVRTNGIPDFSFTWNRLTSWWEIKHGTPDFDSQGYQELTMLRLARRGFARYIIFREENGKKESLIVHPTCFGKLSPETIFSGFDHDKIARFIRGIHDPNER